MQDYLKSFTERALVAARTGDMERQQVQSELEGLLASRPAGASPEMVAYLEFLVTVLKGEDTEELWPALTPELQNIFGQVMQRLKGGQIFGQLKELTQKAVLASKGEKHEQDMILQELEMILASQPREGSSDVARYLSFLMAVARGEEVSELFPSLDNKLAEIFTDVIRDTARSDMMDFFSKLTEAVFLQAKGGTPEGKVPVTQIIAELLSPENPPPPAIAGYLRLLQSVLEDTYRESKRSGISTQFLELFDRYRDSH